jgi:hypothetical protein
MALQKIFADLSVHEASITNVLIKDNEVQGGKLASKSVALDRVSDAFISNLLDTQLRAIYPQLGSGAMALSQNMSVTAYMPAAKSEAAPSYDSATRVWSNLGAVVRTVGYMADTENLVVVRKANNDPVVDASGNEIFGRLEKTSSAGPMPGDPMVVGYRVHFVIKPGAMDEADATIPGGSMAFMYIKQWVAGGSELLRDPGRVIIANPKAVDITESNNIDAVRKALGVSLDGSGSNPLSFTGTNHLNMITDVKAALVALDAALQSGSGNIQAELDATQTGAGLNASGTYIVQGAANYISSAVSLADADSKLDTALKVVADDLAQEILDRAADVDAEEARALAAEGVLQDNIDAEEARALAAEGVLQDNIDAEEARALAAEGVLQDNIDAEEARALAAEGVLQDNIDAEEAARIAADAAIQTELDAVEAAAGFQADGTLAAFTGANYIAASGTLRAAIVAIDTQLKAEADARGSADLALSNELDATQAGAGLSAAGAYVADATTNYLGSAVSLMDADKVLDARVKQIADNMGVVATAGLTFTGTNYLNAKTDVKAALVELDAQIKTEVDARIADVNAEEARALAAEGVLQDNIDAEEARALAAEGVLQDNIDAEEARALAAEGVLQDNIDAEQVRAEAAEAALDARLDTIEAVQWRVRRFTATGDETAVAKDAGHPAIPSADALFVTIDGMAQWPAAAGGVWTLQAAGAGVDLNFSLRAGQTVELKYQA